jgi:hypothetical protein
MEETLIEALPDELNILEHRRELVEMERGDFVNAHAVDQMPDHVIDHIERRIADELALGPLTDMVNITLREEVSINGAKPTKKMTVSRETKIIYIRGQLL